MISPQEEFLKARGWCFVEATREGRNKISWYRKYDRTFPLHFAMWLEEHGWKGEF